MISKNIFAEKNCGQIGTFDSKQIVQKLDHNIDF
jgi:hypothetical protein